MKPFALALAALLLLAVPAQAQRLTGGGCITIGVTCIQFGASGDGASFEARLTTDTISRAAVGLNTSDVPRLSMGPGGASNRDLFLERAGAANLRLGAPDAAAPVAQTLSVQGVVAGTTDTAGAGLTLTGGVSTGTGQGGSILFQTTPGTTTGSTQNPLVTALTILGSGTVGIGPNAAPIGTLWAQGTSASTYAANTQSTGIRSYIVNSNTTDNNMSRLTFSSFDTGGTARNGAAITAVHTAHAATTITSDLIFQTTNVGTSSQKLQLTSLGSVVLNNAAIATNATDGFLYVASGAGTPTGTPTTFTGRVALYVDTTNSQLWMYLGGAWKQPKTPAAAALITWQ